MLTPPLFKVPVPSQESGILRIFVLEESIAPVFTSFQ